MQIEVGYEQDRWRCHRHVSWRYMLRECARNVFTGPPALPPGCGLEVYTSWERRIREDMRKGVIRTDGTAGAMSCLSRYFLQACGMYAGPLALPPGCVQEVNTSCGLYM